MHRFTIRSEKGVVKGYIRTGEYASGRLGEVFVETYWEEQPDESLGPWVDTVCTAVSLGLQYGIPLDVFADKFAHTRFEPSGFASGCNEIRTAKSVLDYVFRWLKLRYGQEVTQS